MSIKAPSSFLVTERFELVQIQVARLWTVRGVRSQGISTDCEDKERCNGTQEAAAQHGRHEMIADKATKALALANG